MAEGQHRDILRVIEPGLWNLRMRDGSESERICLMNARPLIQLRHPALRCRQIVVNQDEDELTIQYACSGQGFGRTRLRIESPRLIQVETQGVAGKSPFDFAVEARRVGACNG